MKDFLLNMVVRWLLDQIRSGDVSRLGDKIENLIIPAIHKWKFEVIARLQVEAAQQTPDNKLDDAIVEALDVFLEALLPKATPGKTVVSK